MLTQLAKIESDPANSFRSALARGFVVLYQADPSSLPGPSSFLSPTPQPLIFVISLQQHHLLSPCRLLESPTLTSSNFLDSSSSILRLRILELLPCRTELAQFMPHHVLRHGDVVVDLAIVHLKFEAYEVWEDGGGAGLRFDGDLALAGFGASDGEAVGLRQRLSGKGKKGTYGTMLGPFQVERARRKGLRRMLRRLELETRAVVPYRVSEMRYS